MARFTPLDDATMTQRQREAAGRIGAGARGGVKGPFPAWLHSPEMAEHFERVGRFLRWETRLPPRLSELAILITARRWRARYEWYAHYPLALKGGLDPAIAEAVRKGERPAAMAGDEAAIFDFVHALQETGMVDDATFETARRLFGEAGVAELLGLAGYYTAVSFTLNVAGVPLPEGEPDPFA
ncbi:MAG: carboxymuconolactone decarboxylase family protein [Rubritepida sp.]|jgi:4-carboxymuconolactone decarboxylase|nr:carboxymuconolactone decarboxylase family protein [Rubritepida sp.]MCU0944130.1 carboxymuconolactone decarboxylase family protein [Rubritepida sp.]